MAEYGAHLQRTTELTATGTATIFSAVSNTRIHVCYGLIISDPAAASASITFYETDAAGNSISEVFHFVAKAAGVEITFDFGEHGWYLGTLGSRLAVRQETANNHIDFAITGYRR